MHFSWRLNTQPGEPESCAVAEFWLTRSGSAPPHCDGPVSFGTVARRRSVGTAPQGRRGTAIVNPKGASINGG